MKITFTLNTGRAITAEIPSFNSEDFTTQLNNPQTTFVTVGNNGFSKHNLASWSEVTVASTLAE